MNRKQIILAVFALDSLLLAAWAVFEHGYLGVFAQAFQNSATILLAAEVVLMSVLIAGWMWVDAHRHGLRVWPYLLVTALVGSAGPLLYLIRRESALKPR